VLDLDPIAPALDASGLYFDIRGEWTESRGYAKWSTTGGYQRLRLEDKSFWSPVKAQRADRVLVRREARDDAPDLLVGTQDFADIRVVVESNPFLPEFHWTRTELVEYRNAEGRRLHGSLLYPAGYDPAKKYPMIVYAYEMLSSQHHYWQSPTERNYYNFITWTQQGYFVLLPDIHFRGRDPGVSLAETLANAITVIDKRGLIDRTKVGFIGHSFGGYHAAYLGARTKLFATTVSGAPLTDFVSFMGQIHWTPGTPEPDHWETGQARMEVPYWEDPDAHHRNSPLHGVHTMTTPILMAHGNKDGVVEFFQSTVFYNFVRRAEKPMVLLVYEDEDHSIQKKPNQIDYHRRILEWFGHYLKGETAPTWITSGVSWQAHDAEKTRVAGGGR
jgi:dipeptidyl aminopeptidase/acylaminoacyl peptidase